MITEVKEGGDGLVGASPEEIEVEFCISRLKSLDEQLGRPKWVVPVRPKDDLEMLLRGAIKLAKESKYMFNILYKYSCTTPHGKQLPCVQYCILYM